VKTILWDFDGTLAVREGGWSGALLEVLAAEVPQLRVTREDIRQHLMAGFPWHTPDVPHTEVRSADQWWGRLEPVFARAFAAVGVEAGLAVTLAGRVRRAFCDVARCRLYDDTIPTRTRLRTAGWTHRILSNHVPELRQIVAGVGLAGLIDEVHSSADTGFEKPHPEAFLGVLRLLPAGARVCMVGDNVQADVLGAERIGIHAVLVRRRDPRARWCCDDLTGVPTMLNATHRGQ
jgi:putative hydrolase of the HAD superfamily